MEANEGGENLRVIVKKQIQSTAMGASLTKISNLNRVSEGFRYLFEDSGVAAHSPDIKQ
jgi:hypothetical protein